MSTALVQGHAHGGAVATHDMSFGERMKFAEMLVTTGFLPNSVKTPAQALAIIQTGLELGIPAMQALRQVHVIQGKPSCSAELQLALFLRAGGKHKWLHSDGQKATLWLKHPNGTEHTQPFTIEEARRANLLNKDGWKMYPDAMLRARAISAGLRAAAPDIIAGMSYTPEELGADVTADGEIVVMPSAEVVAPAEAPTDKQRAFFDKLLQSSVWTDQDRADYRLVAQDATKAVMTRLLDDIAEEGKRRKAAKAEPAEVEAA